MDRYLRMPLVYNGLSALESDFQPGHERPKSTEAYLTGADTGCRLGSRSGNQRNPSTPCDKGYRMASRRPYDQNNGRESFRKLMAAMEKCMQSVQQFLQPPPSFGRLAINRCLGH